MRVCVVSAMPELLVDTLAEAGYEVKDCLSTDLAVLVADGCEVVFVEDVTEMGGVTRRDALKALAARHRVILLAAKTSELVPYAAALGVRDFVFLPASPAQLLYRLANPATDEEAADSMYGVSLVADTSVGKGTIGRPGEVPIHKQGERPRQPWKGVVAGIRRLVLRLPRAVPVVLTADGLKGKGRNRVERTTPAAECPELLLATGKVSSLPDSEKAFQEKTPSIRGSLSLWFPQTPSPGEGAFSFSVGAANVVTVYSAARDVGKTTVSLLLALLAARRGRRVCVVDADPTGRTVTEHFAEGGFPRRIDPRPLPGWGFDYVPSPERPADYTVELAREVLSRAGRYDLVVVDCVPVRLAIAEYIVEYLRVAASVWLVVKPEAKAVADVTRFVRSEMRAAGIGEKVLLVVNRDYPLAPRRPSEVAREVGLPLGLVVPEDPGVEEMFATQVPPTPKKRMPALDAVLSAAEARFPEIFTRGGKASGQTALCRRSESKARV